MIFVQDLLGFGDIDICAGRLAPRQHRQPLDVTAGERIVSRHRGHPAESRQLLESFFLHLFGHACRFYLFLQLFGITLSLILLAQFFLDGLHLLTQVVLALRLLHLILDFRLDLVAQLLNFEFLRKMFVDLLQPQLNVGDLQDLLLVRRGERGQGRGDEVHQPAGLFDIDCDRLQLVGKGRRAGNDLLEQSQNVALQRFDFRAGVDLAL